MGHIQRGIEAWASDLARGLRAEGVDVTLFGGAPSEGVTGLACLRRTGRANKAVLGFFRHLGGWRYALGSPYEIEQTSFSWALWREIRRDFDILHVQDPAIARWLNRAHAMGVSRPRVVYANGTGEQADTMRRFRYLQLLTTEAYNNWKPQAPATQSVFMVPNFIDTTQFMPGDKAAARRHFDLPQDALIVLCCAAIRRYHKRIDHLLAEFELAAGRTDRDILLVVAGGREADTDEIIAEGSTRLGTKVRFLPNVPRNGMPMLYQAADVFTLASLHEMFGIVLLEAMATGLPVVCNDAPIFRSVVGPAGVYRDIDIPGNLADGLTVLFDDEHRAAVAREARPWVDGRFSTTVVMRDIVSMYASVLDGARND